ncbi:MAG TPA: HAD family hydrolase [Chloroflexota bacterium]
MPAALQAVTFDLWQTLMLDGREQGQRRAELRAERMHEVLCRAGLELTRRDIEEALHDIWRRWQEHYWDRQVDPGFQAQLRWLSERLGVPPGDAQLQAELEAAYVEPIFASPPRLEPEAIPVLTELQARGLKLGLICNTSVTPGSALRRLLAGWDLDRLLGVMLFSDETGVRKPAPEIFRLAAQRLGVELPAMLHVGDRPDIDVQGAISAGAQALLVGPEAPLSQLVAKV